MLPRYANTHTEASGTAEHAVLFAGSGCTGAINKLVGILGLCIPSCTEDRYHVSSAIPAHERPVVFVGPFERHPNELVWRESIADVVTIHEDADGHLDQQQLTDELRRYADRPLKIGSFSAASNVTGIVSDVHCIATLLHNHGALSFWDYAVGVHQRVSRQPYPTRHRGGDPQPGPTHRKRPASLASAD